MRYSIASIIKNGVRKNVSWPPQWRNPQPKSHYEVIIIGGGLHGLATAYYLAKYHNIKDIAVVEKGWIGGGNAGRNTTVVRSNYMIPENRFFYEHSLKMWEALSHELNYNVMFSQRSHITLLHSPQMLDEFTRRYNFMRITGADGEIWSLDKLHKKIPRLALNDLRFPIYGAAVHPRAGTARHDAVVWGYARAACQLGVDILQNCEVKGINTNGNNVTSIETTTGLLKANKFALAVAGHTSLLWKMAGLEKLPLESHKLQAFVTEPVKPFLDHVVAFGVGGAHFYISQSDKGGLVFGGDIDWYKSYAQRGNFSTVQNVAESITSLFPAVNRIRLLRHWAGVMDMTMDGSPFICHTPLYNLYLNAGWNYGGFKATPASGWFFSDLIANDRPDEIIKEYNLDRFMHGNQIDERGAGADAKLHG